MAASLQFHVASSSRQSPGRCLHWKHFFQTIVALCGFLSSVTEIGASLMLCGNQYSAPGNVQPKWPESGNFYQGICSTLAVFPTARTCQDCNLKFYFTGKDCYFCTQCGWACPIASKRFSKLTVQPIIVVWKAPFTHPYVFAWPTNCTGHTASKQRALWLTLWWSEKKKV